MQYQKGADVTAAVPAVIDLLKEPDARVREDAAAFLIEVGFFILLGMI